MTLQSEAIKEKAHELALSDDSRYGMIPPKAWKHQWASEVNGIIHFIYSLQDCETVCQQPAEQWLLDHAGFLLEQWQSLLEELRDVRWKRFAFLRRERQPRMLFLCEEYLELADGELDEEKLRAFFHSYQDVSVLTMAEVSAMPLFMRLAALRKLAKIAEQLRFRRDLCKRVEQLFDYVRAQGFDAARLAEALDRAGMHMPLSGPVIVHLISHLREYEEDSARVREWLLCRLENGADSIDQMQQYEQELQRKWERSTARLIGTLRRIERTDWTETFRQISAVEQILRGEPTGLYEQMDENSRRVLRGAIASLAGRGKLSESRIAETAVELAARERRADNAQPELMPRESFIAYYLLESEGVRRLKKELAICGDLKRAGGISPWRNDRQRYFLALAACIAIALALLAWIVGGGGKHTAPEWLAMLAVLALPASEWGVAAAHWLIEQRVRPRPLLRYDFSGGVPEDAMTMVVVPVIWSSPEDVEELADRLELHYVSNREPHLRFALLGDFADAKQERLPQDAIVEAEAKRKIEALNEKYAGPGETIFYYLQRRRLWNECENAWMGWERKRGKLVEFVELLRGRRDTTFRTVVGDESVFPRIRYVITLDADTLLPLESARQMIAAIHFPYNRPRLNAQGTRVSEGYGVLQPRIATSYKGATVTRLTELLSGAPGIDPYAFAVSDPYQDSVGEGIFTGKGIFDVDTFSRVLCDRIPDNRVLSHDLLEGGFLRAGLLADVELMDEQPSSYAAYQKRLHRWVRGDWQLVRWLFPKVCDRQGVSRKVDLTWLTRWQMIDNMRRSLMPPALYLLLLLGVTVLPGNSWRWLAAAAATLFIPLIRSMAGWRQWWPRPRLPAAEFAQSLIALVMLPYQAALMLDAIGRTLYRLCISKKHLLEWVSAAEVERRSRNRKPPLLLGWKGGAAAALVMAAASLWPPAHAPAAGLALAGLWAIAPAAAYWLNQPVRIRREMPEPDERNELMRLAEQIWAFFEDHVNEENHWLPPDNVQIDPPNGTAHRTSPTNIGLYLASALAARDFGFIDTAGLIERLERTWNTLERLETWNGHLFNWIDTRTLEVLPPRYISSVDSGNLVCSMIAVKEGLAEWLALDKKGLTDPVRRRGEALAERMEAWIRRTDFSPLYDSTAQLFSLGYNETHGRQDPVLYDLLASEARQTSFIAIALGQIPLAHWRRLGRSMTRAGGGYALVSWSGTMFEYLMPCLYMRTYGKTVWDHTCRAVVRKQAEYAAERKVPFGISESGYYAFDHQLNYQYRAFGVPGLGFQRGLENDLVIAPYATMLALMFEPRLAVEHLRKLEALGARGKYGFYEAADFTAERMPEGKTHQIVRSFMAHHQGMALLSIVNVLMDGAMIRRFHRDKRVQAAEWLLQERMPARPRAIRKPAVTRTLAANTSKSSRHGAFRDRHIPGKPDAVPETAVLSNGQLTTVVTDSGGGYVRLRKTALTRWSDDLARDGGGIAFYIRDTETNTFWSPSYEPARIPSPAQRVVFGWDRVTFMREDGDVRTTLEISVAPEHNADVRRLTLVNTGDRPKTLEATTYMELVLAPPEVEDAHPAFSKLFVETEYAKDYGCLVARRRPRHDDDKEVWAAHAFIADAPESGAAEYDTDRSSIVGRGHSLARPVSLTTPLAGRTGAVTDPAFAIRRRFVLKPRAQVQLIAVSCIGESREEVLGAVRSYADPAAVERAFRMMWTRHRIVLRELRLSEEDAADWQQLSAKLLYPSPLTREQRQAVAANEQGVSSLWAYGISGDRPIWLVAAGHREHLPFVTRVLHGAEYLCWLGLSFDLVVLNESDEGYMQELQHALQKTVEETFPRRGGFCGAHVLSRRTMPDEDVRLLIASARVVLRADGRSVKAQLQWKAPETRRKDPEFPAVTASADAHVDKIVLPDDTELAFFNGWGGFADGGKQYRMRLHTARPLPAPWSNVLANPEFGCLVTERGTGYTWWRNSREFKLTPWFNDPVLDPPGEAGYFRDEETGAFWPLYPGPAHEDQFYEVTHAQGYSRFRHERGGIFHETTWVVPPSDPVKVMEVRIVNKSGRPRKLSLTYYAEWVLGVRRGPEAPFIVTEWHEASACLLAHNMRQEHFRGATAFLGICTDAGPEAKRAERDTAAESMDERSWTGSRGEFWGRGGASGETPEAMKHRRLSGATGVTGDACGAVRVGFTLEPDEERVLYVMLGCERSREAAVRLAQTYRDRARCRQAFADSEQFWSRTLGQIEVQTPSAETDALMNGWLLYQALCCRMWARTGFYQAGGAYGYRDQLQDSLSLLHTRPDLTRAQILLHASHQYEEGDVQHWWHEETGMGIRTRFSDDFLWLPYAASRYVDHTGDDTLWDAVVPYLRSGPLADGEHERYEKTELSPASGTLYEHCTRAIELALGRIGEHGLPLIGIGDWNDGMSSIGDEGRGESVWLCWFLCAVLERFAEYARKREEHERSRTYAEARNRLVEAANRHAWDGSWYRRAFTDAGGWIGSESGPECRIDAIAQSWSVISGAAPADRAERAMDSFDRLLVDRKLSLARLLDPPFDRMKPSPGYIQGYPPGIRENGGQYTHGVIWGVVAWSMLGRNEKAWELFHLLNPIRHTQTMEQVARYRGEPYVMAADVYTARPHEGRAGWTWYTGAAGWMYQACLEWLLGVRRQGNRLTIRPALPDDWPGFHLTYRFGRTTYRIAVRNRRHEAGAEPHSSNNAAQAQERCVIELTDDGKEHRVELTC